jgi:hypothetical protein
MRPIQPTGHRFVVVAEGITLVPTLYRGIGSLPASTKPIGCFHAPLENSSQAKRASWPLQFTTGVTPPATWAAVGQLADVPSGTAEVPLKADLVTSQSGRRIGARS